MSDKHLSVFPKVLLYVFDVGSDWTNGAFMIQEGGSRFNISCLGWDIMNQKRCTSFLGT